MDSIIELQRQSHEEIERYEQALAEILIKPTTGTRGALRNEHKALDILSQITTRKTTLKEQYADPLGLRATELALLSVPAGSTPQEDLKEFYVRFEKIKTHHRSLGEGMAEEDVGAFGKSLRELVESDGMVRRKLEDGEEEIIDPLDTMFSGEEAMGRYLDLYIPHAQYINLRGAKRLSYLQYLGMLLKGRVAEDVEWKDKEGAGYLDYIETLHSYLFDFLRRTHPLLDLSAHLNPVEEEFEREWKEGKVHGWQKGTAAAGVVEGGIVCSACRKSYAKQTVYDAHLTSKKHIKATEKIALGETTPGEPDDLPTQSTSTSTTSSKNRTSALLTRLTETLLVIPPFPTLLSDSRQNVERKSALTAKEREQELEEPAEEAPPVETGEGIEEDDDGKIYNPLKLPLGWDGRPIPYWLYKLHGLGVEYKCEICSDFSYMGRKAFDRHFQESRHAFGMRALGLPNTKHFHEITKIQDALSLAERLKHEGRQEAHQAERTEEFEDAEGNVYDKKTYDDLKRQGLI